MINSTMGSWWIGLLVVSLVAAQNAQQTYDVVVVGAGLSGLSAARRIKEQEPAASILILEARSSVGGRVMSSPLNTINGKQNIDIGAQWIGRKHTELLTLAQALNLTVEAQPMCGQRTVIVDRSRARRAVEWSDALGVSPTIDAVLGSTDIEQLGAISVKDFVSGMELAQTDRDGMNRLLQTFYDSPENEISSLQVLLTAASDNGTVDDLLASMGHGLGLRVKEGLGELTRRLAVDLDIQFEQDVSSIQEAEGGLVHVFSNNNEFVARQVIVALPPVLAANISLNPPMPDSMEKFMSSYGGRGVASYFAVTFQEPFWRANNQSGQIIYAGDGNLLWLTTFDISDNNQCTTATAGTLWGIAHFAQETPAEQRYQMYVRTIQNSLGSSSNPIDITDHQFCNDQYSMGTVGVLPPTSDAEMQSFVSALYNVDESIPFSDVNITNEEIPRSKIHFTAAELSKVSMGMMNGAVHHGRIVAEAVIAQLIAGSPTNQILRDQPQQVMPSTVMNPLNDDTASTSVFQYETSSQYPATTEEPSTTPSPSTVYDFHYSTQLNPSLGLVNDDVDRLTSSPVESSTSFEYSTSTQYPDGAFTTDSSEPDATIRYIQGLLLHDEGDSSTQQPEEIPRTTVFQYSTSTQYPQDEFTQQDTTPEQNDDAAPMNSQRDDPSSRTESPVESSTTVFSYSTSSFYAEGTFADAEVDTTLQPLNDNDGDGVTVHDSTPGVQHTGAFAYQTSTHYPDSFNDDANQASTPPPTHFSLGNDDSTTDQTLTQRMFDPSGSQPQQSAQNTFDKTAEFQNIENAIQTLNNTLYQAPIAMNNVRGAINTLNETISQVPHEARQSLAARLSSILNSLLNYVRK